MKRQIRFGMFESNSSTTHVLYMVSRNVYEKYEQGGYLYDGSDFGWKNKEIAPKKGEIYSREEVIEMIKNNYEYYKPFNEDEMDEDEIKDEWNDIIWEAEFVSEESIENQQFETFYDSYRTPSGEEVVAFGYYGYN